MPINLLGIGWALLLLASLWSLAAGADESVNPSYQLQEVVVTAPKRSESVLDVPIPMTVLAGTQLEGHNVDSLADMADCVPGLSIGSFGSPDQRAIVLRGLAASTDQSIAASLVATYIDDVPVGATNGFARSSEYGVDFVPYDIDQVEVLRGPQGALYGADAMGGIIKYTLHKPDLTNFALRVGGDLGNIEGAGNAGGSGRANLPLVTGTLGLRVSPFYKSNPGFTENVGTGIDDAKWSEEAGGRATLLWRATDRLSVQTTALWPDIYVGDLREISVYGATGTRSHEAVSGDAMPKSYSGGTGYSGPNANP